MSILPATSSCAMPSTERLQLVADILAKSLVLSHYETRIADLFDRIEPLAATLGEKGRAGASGKVLLRHIGDVLMMQQKMVGRVETAETPELLWEHPELERFYMRLADEYELRERDRRIGPQARHRLAHGRDPARFGANPQQPARRVVYRAADRRRAGAQSLPDAAAAVSVRSADQERHRDHDRGRLKRPDPAFGMNQADQRQRASDQQSVPWSEFSIR